MMMQITKNPFPRILGLATLLTALGHVAGALVNKAEAQGDRFARQGTTLVADKVGPEVVCWALNLDIKPHTNLNADNVPVKVVQQMQEVFTTTVSPHRTIKQIKADCDLANPNRDKVGRQAVFANFEQFPDGKTQATCSRLNFLTGGGPRFTNEGETRSIVMPLIVMDTQNYNHPLSRSEKKAYIETCSTLGDRFYEGQKQGASPFFVLPQIPIW
jgi:hypothetical protein